MCRRSRLESCLPGHCGRRLYRRSEEHTSELQSHSDLVCRLLLEKKKYGQMVNKRQRIGKRGVLWRQYHAVRARELKQRVGIRVGRRAGIRNDIIQLLMTSWTVWM